MRFKFQENKKRMVNNITFGDRLNINIEVPEIEALKKINPYRPSPKILKNGYYSRLIDQVPTYPGVYFLYKDETMLYIGNGKSIRQRINYHSSKRCVKEIALQERLNPDHINYISWIKIDDKIERELIETIYLNNYPTAWNNSKVFVEFKNYPERPWDYELEAPEVVEYIQKNVRPYDLMSMPEYLYDYCKNLIGNDFDPPINLDFNFTL